MRVEEGTGRVDAAVLDLVAKNVALLAGYLG